MLADLLIERSVPAHPHAVASPQPPPRRQPPADRIANVTHWRELMGGDTRAGCPPGTAFATFLSGGGYLPGALCLLSSLRAAGNLCSLVIVLDDRGTETTLSAADAHVLRDKADAENGVVVRLTQLMSTLPRLSEHVRYGIREWRNHSAGQSGEESTVPLLAAGAGRRLYETGGNGTGLFATHAKVWFWSLPYSRILVLDLDMVVRARIDGLLRYAFRQEIAAVGCGFWGASDGELGSFNSGLMLIKPNTSQARAHLASLTGKRSRYWHHHKKACESHVGDQSVLNAEFANNWHQLPTSLIGAAHSGNSRAQRSFNRSGLEAIDPAIVHFMGEPKPWEVLQDLRKHEGRNATVPSSSTTYGLWRDHCMTW